MTEKKYSYDRFGAKGMRVGQAVYDILSQEQAPQTVEETLEAWAPDFVSELEETIENNINKFQSPFYVFVLTKKEMWAENVIRNYFIARQSDPQMAQMMVEYPNFVKTLYKVDGKKGAMKLDWTLPGIEDCKSILKNQKIHDPTLIGWIKSCFKELEDGLVEYGPKSNFQVPR